MIQNNLFNQSKLRTVVVCILTTNLKRANASGNVLIPAGEGNLPEPRVANITQLVTLDKQDLGQKIGALSAERGKAIVSGIHLLIEPEY